LGHISLLDGKSNKVFTHALKFASDQGNVAKRCLFWSWHTLHHYQIDVSIPFYKRYGMDTINAANAVIAWLQNQSDNQSHNLTGAAPALSCKVRKVTQPALKLSANLKKVVHRIL
jgi:hypothetical protein